MSLVYLAKLVTVTLKQELQTSGVLVRAADVWALIQKPKLYLNG